MILIFETPVICIILITWYSWADHVILTCDLVLLWSCDYTTQQLFVQDTSCWLYICHTMHARFPCTWSIVSIFLLLLLVSVLDTANHNVLIISMPYCTVTASSYSLLLFFSLHVLFLVHFWWIFIIFQYLVQKANIEGWS